MDRFQGHISYIKHMSSAAMARQFASHMNLTYQRITVHIQEYIKLPEDIPRSNLKSKGIDLDSQTKHLFQMAAILDWGKKFSS